MKKRMKQVLALLMCATMVIGTVACGSKKGSNKAGGDGAAGVAGELTGDLTVQVFINENGVSADIWQQILDDFEADNPDLNFTAHVGPTVNTQLSKNWLSGKNTPDVVLIGGKGLAEYALASAGCFMDLTDWYNEATVYGTDEKISDKVIPELLETYEGQFYEMPLIAQCYGLWYSDTAYTEQNLKIHNNFDEFMANGATLLKNEKASLIYPGQYANYLVWGLLMPAVGAYGQEFFNEVVSAENPEIYKDERFKAILTRFKEFIDAGYVANGTGTLDHLGAQSSWLKQNAALITTGSWVEQEMKSEIPGDFNMKFTAAGLNTADQKPCVALVANGVAIAANTKNEANAKSFVSFLYQDKYLERLAAEGGALSACNIDVNPDLYTKISKEVIEYINSDEVSVVYKNKDWGEAGEELNNIVNGLVVGSIKTVDEACERMVNAAGGK